MKTHAAVERNGYINSSYSEITPQLFQGGMSSIYYLPLDLGRIDTLIICAMELCDAQGPEETFDFGYNRALLLGFDDGNFVPEFIVEQASDQAVHDLKLGRRVSIICAQGLNRSGLVSAITLLKMGDLDPITTLRTRRHRTVLSNPWFSRYVKDRVEAHKLRLSLSEQTDPTR